MISNLFIRTGIGYDSHCLVDGLKLIIGGVEVEFSKGSKGHSDGDALIHSIVDAMLGALSLGDIGKYFPSNHKKWKNISSSVFLEFAVEKIRSKGYEINNIDANIIIQKPKLFNYKTKIIKNISKIVKIKESQVSVKAKTTDFLGFIGDGSGWSCQALVTLYKK